eukprot:scaffold4827_cov109-Isochrysis_galbana.AAC.18
MPPPARLCVHVAGVHRIATAATARRHVERGAASPQALAPSVAKGLTRIKSPGDRSLVRSRGAAADGPTPARSRSVTRAPGTAS